MKTNNDIKQSLLFDRIEELDAMLTDSKSPLSVGFDLMSHEGLLSDGVKDRLVKESLDNLDALLIEVIGIKSSLVSAFLTADDKNIIIKVD